MTNSCKCARCGKVLEANASQETCPDCQGAAEPNPAQGNTPANSTEGTLVPDPARAPEAMPGTPPPYGLARAAIWGFAWIILFFNAYILSYTPVGWAITAALRDRLGNGLTGLFLLGPLALLAASAPFGATLLGLAGLRQIRNSGKTLGGFGLALFDALFFPILILDIAMVVGLRASPFAGGAASRVWVVPALTLLVAAIDILVGYRVWKWARDFVNKPPLPVAQRLPGTWFQALKKAGWRLLLLVPVIFVLMEILLQFEVHWKESTGELWDMGLAVASLAGLVWVFWPRYRLKLAPIFVGAGIILSCTLMLGLAICYTGYVRPNAGLYREAEWLSRIPGYQQRYRLGLAKNVWRRLRVEPNFRATDEFVLACPEENSWQFLSLQGGRQLTRKGTNESPRDTMDWARQEKFDLAAGLKNGKLVVHGLDLAAFPVNNFDLETSTQNVVDYWLFEAKPPKESTLLWPMLEHWLQERNFTAEYVPRPFRTNDGVYWFRTRDGTMGVLEIVGQTNAPVAAEVRCKQVRASSSR